jgi:hypothetical protein
VAAAAPGQADDAVAAPATAPRSSCFPEPGGAPGGAAPNVEGRDER